MQKLVGGNLEILAVNLGPSDLIGPSLPCRRPFGSLRNNPPRERLRGFCVGGSWKARLIPSRPSARRNLDLGTTLHAVRREAREITNVTEGCRPPMSILLISDSRIATRWASLKNNRQDAFWNTLFRPTSKLTK